MIEVTQRRPIPVARAVLTWLIPLVAALATAFWLERFDRLKALLEEME